MKDSAREIDCILASWGRWTRAGGNIGGLGYPSMTVIAKMSAVPANRVRPDENVMEELDIIIGRLNQPFRRIVHRHYVDVREPSGYYPEMRTQEMKAKSEGMTVGSYKVSLHIARNQINEKLERI